MLEGNSLRMTGRFIHFSLLSIRCQRNVVQEPGLKRKMEPSASFLGLLRLGDILHIPLVPFPSLKGQGKYFNKKSGLEN